MYNNNFGNMPMDSMFANSGQYDQSQGSNMDPNSLNNLNMNNMNNFNNIGVPNNQNHLYK